MCFPDFRGAYALPLKTYRIRSTELSQHPRPGLRHRIAEPTELGLGGLKYPLPASLRDLGEQGVEVYVVPASVASVYA